MGHERVGILPRTQPWKDIINQIGAFTVSQSDISGIAKSTLKNVRSRFNNMDKDSGVQSSFEYLVIISHAFQKNDPIGYLIDKKILKEREITPLRIAKSIKEFVASQINPSEYGAIAQASAIDALNSWIQKTSTEDLKLFDEEIPYSNFLKKLSNGSGFCEISRLYFSKFTERYLQIFS